MTITELTNALRETALTTIKTALDGAGYEILEIGTGKIALPVLDAEQNERYLTVTVSVPKGSRDGDAFDGYALAQEYQEHIREKARKAEEVARLKAEKAAERERKKAERAAAKEKEKTKKEEPEG